MSVELLMRVRDRVLPMLEFAAEEYRHRTPEGYPVVIDAVEQGFVGLELDASHAVYLVSDGEQLFVDIYRRASRTDARTSAGRQKHGGLPFHDRRPLDPGASDQTYRNVIAELMSYWNTQPGILYISDS